MLLNQVRKTRRHALLCLLSGWLIALTTTGLRAQDATSVTATEPIQQGQRVYSIGHSFHVFMPAILNNLAKDAKIADHTQVGLSSIGGSRVIQHWNVADDKFKSKELLTAGNVDVVTMAPIFLPDDGIEKFVSLAVEHNPKIRITLQEFWLPFDWYDPPVMKAGPDKDHNSPTIEDLRKRHAPYFESMDEQVRQLNQKLGKTVVYVAPVGQAVIALREKIVAGEVPVLTKQQDLFTDPIGHARPPLQALVAYCHFASIYRRSPVGLPVPAVMGGGKDLKYDDKLVKILQEIAWDAVTSHPLSGVRKENKPQ